ncbi:MAG TPA: histidine kinase [Solirubrobacteraceae bacterium]|nr:histidine kinase [Solirubrobacteraceae bacterium]
MLFARFRSSRPATVIRWIGLGLVSWTIVSAHHYPPSGSGRGLVVLIAGIVIFVSWCVWIVTSSRSVYRLTPELWTLAIAGGIMTVAAPNAAGSVAVFVASSSAAIRVGLGKALPVIATGVLALAVSALLYDSGAWSVLAYALGFTAVALATSNVRQLRLRAEQSELLLAQTQRSNEEQLRAARLEEQTRIAREIHDVLAHSLAGLAIQLEATDALLADGADPATVRERIQRAHTLARDGLRETRRAVGALRGEPVAPAASAVRALVDEYEPEPRLVFTGDESRLEGRIGETVVRVVQEALTNVRKHAPGAPVQVSIGVSPEGVDVLVENRLTVSIGVPGELAAAGGGYGLRGMRERAQLLGGTLSAGPNKGAWRVALHLPLEVRG